jgi:hypothetical protein
VGEYREASKGAGFFLLWGVVAVIVVGIVAVGIWAFRVITADVKGEGDAIIEQQSAENWTAAQARFEELYADIVATDRKIQIAAAALLEDPDDETAEDTYAGTVNYCLTIVGEYNAEARKFLSEDFRAADLPDQISDLDPETDCKEN